MKKPNPFAPKAPKKPGSKQPGSKKAFVPFKKGSGNPFAKKK